MRRLWQHDNRRCSGTGDLLRAFAVVVAALLATLVAGRADAQTVPAPLFPTSVAFDAAGDLFFADTDRNEIYESSLAGVLTVVAGNGIEGYSGDGGAAASAELDSPQAVAIGADGTLYIADTGNQRIRVVSGGVISTFAGSGSAGFGGDGGPAASATFRGLNALAIDATGNLLVCDSGNERIRRISAGVIDTVAGNGTQGFAGDGGVATSAELDTPMGLAVSASGQIFVADSHNDRIRSIATNGFISTFAGNGMRGYSGDGGAATSAELALPRGLIATSSGAVIFADSNNQRIRMVSANGTISTIIGNGVQGSTNDGTVGAAVGMDSPRGVAVSSFGAPVYADALNHLVRESIADGDLYVPAGLASTRVSSVTLSVGPTTSNGQTSASVKVTGSAATPQGVVELLDGANILAPQTLQAGAAVFAPQTLTPGAHSLSVAYLGDGLNPAAVSAPYSVSAATAVITATANAASMQYGQGIPALTGSLSGVPPQIASNVTAVFTTTAGPHSAPGSYPIAASLTGSAGANYSVVMSPTSGSLQIVPASSLTSEQPLAQNSYAGLPLLLTADVRSSTQGVPTGTVRFLSGGNLVATGAVVNGVASGTYLSPPTGTFSVTASYGGDQNFAASLSQAVTTTVSVIPDFALTSTGSTTQTVAEADVANYSISVGAQSGTFTGVVDLSATGLPPGATVSFSPPQVVPGAGSATVTMSVQTSEINTSIAAMVHEHLGGIFACLLFPGLLMFSGKRRLRTSLALCVGLTVLLGAVGCGARTISTAALRGQTYTLTVTGTSTNLAGSIVSHSIDITMIVD